MAIHYFYFIWIVVLLAFASSLTVNPQVEGCSLVGLDLQSCLIPNTKTPFSLDSCCKTLHQAIVAGCYCLRSLLGPSNYPVLSTELAISFSSCYISLPSLTHCHEPRPFGIAPPVAALPLAPVLKPPNLPRDEPVEPLPAKGNEIPPNNSSIVERNSTLSIPQRWDYLSSDAANVKILLQYSTNLLIVTVFACIA